MNVELISYSEAAGTMPADINDVQQLIAFCARVSNPSNQTNTDTSEKLIRYLIKNQHWSPLEMVSVCLEIETTRDIARQMLRHRSFSFQEFSQRYSVATDFEDIEFRLQGDKNRQVGENLLDPTDLRYADLYTSVQEAIEASTTAYNKMIQGGIAKEVARMILPLTTETTMYMKGSLRSWVHYIDLRTENNTQKEHRLIADECKNIFVKNFPTISEALQWKAE